MKNEKWKMKNEKWKKEIEMAFHVWKHHGIVSIKGLREKRAEILKLKCQFEFSA